MNAILITGASSGLGAALARRYAHPDRHLLLWGRDHARLEATADECRRRGANVDLDLLDLRDVTVSAQRLAAADARTPIALAIFNAGVGGVAPPGRAVEAPERVHEIATVNFTAAVVGASAIAERMRSRGRGHIVLIGSIAESFPLPMAPTYAGTKAGLAMFAEALGLRLRPSGVAVTLVSLGFVDTPMSRQVPSPKPFLLDADRAAAIIARRIERRPRRIVVPWPFALIRTTARFLPHALTRLVLQRLT